MSVNEADYLCWNLLAAGSRGRRRTCLVVRRMCCPAHNGNEVCCGVGDVVQWNVWSAWP